jgi:hypothetical protein
MRPLELSPSALSDAEFDLYTTSLHSAVRDAGDDMREYSDGEGGFYYDDVALGKGSIRNWLRDNYDHVSATAIDKVCSSYPRGLILRGASSKLIGLDFENVLSNITNG